MWGGGREDSDTNKLAVWIGERVRDARKEAGYSQAELALRTTSHINTIGKIENGNVEPTITTLMLIATALEKPITYFLPMPPEYTAAEDDLPEWIREAVIQMKYISDSRTQRQVIAMIKAAANEEIKEAHEIQDRQLLEDLDRMVARGEKLSRVQQRERRRLQHKYG
jgi:transcriptional regulator with XRE-family HTH domain